MLRVIGAGFGRTGTMSLKFALETLGFGRCYHFTEMLKSRHGRRWLEISEGAAPDWDSLFAGYQSTTDWPAASFYRELADAYPDSKVILTVRDPDDWYRSVTTTIYRLRSLLPAWMPGASTLCRLTDNVVWRGEFDGKIENREHAIARFEAHNAEVRRSIPEDRLLVFNVREGWEPLCGFLQAPVPDGIDFPFVNDARSIGRAIRLIVILRFLALLFGAALAVYVVSVFVT